MNNSLKVVERLIWFAGIVVLGFLVYSGIQKLNGAKSDYEAKMEVWKQERDTLLAHNERLNIETDSLQQAVMTRDSVFTVKQNELNRSVRRSREITAKLDAALDSLRRVVPAECDSVVKIADGYRAEIDSLNVVIVKKDSIIGARQSDIWVLNGTVDSLQNENQKLVDKLNDVPEYQEEKLLGFIPLPSRKLTFLIGLAAGAGATYAATR